MKIAVVLSVVVACCVAVALADFYDSYDSYDSYGGFGGLSGGLGGYSSFGSGYGASIVPVPVQTQGGSGAGYWGLGCKYWFFQNPFKT